VVRRTEPLAAGGGRLPPRARPRPEDEALLLAVARGDQAAFAALYDRVAPLVHGVVRRVVRDPAQSEEVTQEVLVEVWRTATRFDPDRGSARDLDPDDGAPARDRPGPLRAGQPGPHRAGRPPRPRPPLRRGRRAGRDLRSSTSRSARRARSTLTELQREAVELAYYQGYTYREVAELLDTPLGTIKTRMRDGLIRLRDAMGVA
jgi:RNA polymerase sigma-70 factor, ECF subfamily